MAKTKKLSLAMVLARCAEGKHSKRFEEVMTSVKSESFGENEI
jgi:hypothetical protein